MDLQLSMAGSIEVFSWGLVMLVAWRKGGVLTTLVCMTILGSPSLTATAQDVAIADPALEPPPMTASYDRDGWMGELVDAGGQFVGCMVKQDPPILADVDTPDPSTIFFGLLQTPDAQWTMVFAKPGGLKANLKWPMTVRIDDTVVHEGMSVVGAQGVAILQPPLSPDAVTKIRAGQVLTIATERGQSRYKLAGSAQAMAFAGKCVTDVLASADSTGGVLQVQAQNRKLGAALVQPNTTAIASSPRALTGTGFMASAQGHLLTNAHVVKGCNVATALLPGKAPQTVRILALDPQNDLALLSPLTGTDIHYPTLRTGARTGEPIAAYGFPYAGLLPSMGNFTLGNITATAGLQDDTRYLQMSAPIQPGSSGGPLLDTAGNLVGVVVARLNPKAEGGGAQNVNFAIKSDVVATFLSTHRIGKEPSKSAAAPLLPADLADTAKSFTVFISCDPGAVVATTDAPPQLPVGMTKTAGPATAVAKAPIGFDSGALVSFLKRQRGAGAQRNTSQARLAP
jgi:S1-C subfamily serine protease